MKTELDCAKSTMQKTINRLIEQCTFYMYQARRRKAQVRKFSEFTQKLKEEGRVSHEELKEYFKPEEK